MGEFVKATSDAAFDNEVLQSDTPVLVDFWAEWCGPCKMITPIVDKVAEDYAQRVSVFKMNVDDNPETPSKYGVRGIPSLLIYKGGEVVDTHVGALTESQLTAFIDKNLA
ncbi:MAG: thioredoxin TrxA [Coxiellaceae bacterium]|nr:thioredoxin TrxA [Coxiellaceae bacterium]